MTAVTSSAEVGGQTIAACGDDPLSTILSGGSLEELFARTDDALVAFDYSGRLVAANAASERLFGYEPGGLNGCPVTALFPDGFDLETALSSADTAGPVLSTALGAGDGRVVLAHLSATGVQSSGVRVSISLSVILVAETTESVVVAVMRESTSRPADARRPGSLGTQATGRDMLALQRELLVEVARGRGVGGIAAALHARTGRRVLILEPDGYVIAAAGYTDEDPAPRGPVIVHRGNAPHAARQRHGDSWTAAARPDRALLGSIVILDPNDNLPESDQLALEQAISILSAELLQSVGSVEAAAADWNSFATELLDGLDAELLSLHAKALGYKLERAHRVVSVQAPGVGPEGVLVIEQAMRNMGVRIPLVTVHADHHILITPDDLSWEEIGSALTGEFGVAARIGVGGTYQVGDLHWSLTEAVMALELGATVNRDNAVTTFEDLGVWGFLIDYRQPHKLREFVDKWIGALIEVDELHGSELVKTLTSYLKESCAAEATASILHIHRNTLRYRLAKIATITGHDLGDADQRFQLELACRAWTVLQAVEATRTAAPNRDSIRERARL